METRSQAKSKLKRRRDGNESDERKSQRLVSSAEPERTTKIIDLNDDCLMKLFGNLDFQSLFNVAVANEYLRPAAREVYKRKFGTKKVTIKGYEIRWYKMYCAPEGCTIFGLKTSLQFLRCFGPSLTNLSIDYNRFNHKRYEHVHQYISDYCASSLAHIEFWSMPVFEMDPFQKVFVNIKEIEVWYPTLEQQLQSYAKWFPNSSRLEHLRVAGFHLYNRNGFVAVLLRGAHQLKRIEMEIFDKQVFSIETLLEMIKDKPLLAELKYNLSNDCQPMLVDLVTAQWIISEHPALVEIILPQFQFSFDGIIALIIQLESLNKFRVAMLRADYWSLAPQLCNQWLPSDAHVYYEYNYLIASILFTRNEQ